MQRKSGFLCLSLMPSHHILRAHDQAHQPNPEGNLDSIFFSRLGPLADDFAKEESTKMSDTCLNQIDLARRWRISPRTLERWRWLREGPRYLKLGGRVLYRVADIEAYEQSIVCLTKEDTVNS